jgi:septal ring factor EnvC (AmiA/AmiB activator)
VETVNYLALTSMLLNELQKQTTQVHQLSAQVAEVRAGRDRAREQCAAFEARLSALEHRLAVRGRGPALAAAFGR